MVFGDVALQIYNETQFVEYKMSRDKVFICFDMIAQKTSIRLFVAKKHTW